MQVLSVTTIDQEERRLQFRCGSFGVDIRTGTTRSKTERLQPRQLGKNFSPDHPTANAYVIYLKNI